VKPHSKKTKAREGGAARLPFTFLDQKIEQRTCPRTPLSARRNEVRRPALPPGKVVENLPAKLRGPQPLDDVALGSDNGGLPHDGAKH
jgi:hypothetical protein